MVWSPLANGTSGNANRYSSRNGARVDRFIPHHAAQTNWSALLATFAGGDHSVSPTYAREICTAEFGYGLEGVLRDRGAALSGILNGVDYTVWNPAERGIASPYRDAWRVPMGMASRAGTDITAALTAAALPTGSSARFG